MRPSGRVRTNTVTVERYGWVNDHGVRKRASAPTSSDTLRASVHPTGSEHSDAQGRESSVTGYRVGFAVDPVVNPGDKVLWQGRTLVAQSRANDQAGRGNVWVVECQEVAP